MEESYPAVGTFFHGWVTFFHGIPFCLFPDKPRGAAFHAFFLDKSFFRGAQISVAEGNNKNRCHGHFFPRHLFFSRSAFPVKHALWLSLPLAAQVVAPGHEGAVVLVVEVVLHGVGFALEGDVFVSTEPVAVLHVAHQPLCEVDEVEGDEE